MPDAPATPRIFAIHAHPDDLEFQCAGTLALLKQRGCEILMATMTAGDLGSAELPPEEISRIRREEAGNSAELLGAAYQCLEFRDLSICFDNDSRHRVAEAIRRARPDIVITAPPVDYMSDHEITCRLVRDACFNASVPHYSTRQWDPAPPLSKIPHLYYVDALEGMDYFGNPQQPGFVVDISSVYELKQNMLACHDSQRAWLRQQHGIDEYLESCKRWSQSRGRAINADFGEGFTQHKGHPYPATNKLLEILENA
jgi:LmbE family N-acetylglucosaminyl deacetylase